MDFLYFLPFSLPLSRGYPQFKITENISAEIFQVVLDEARESYRPEIVWELPSNTVEDMEHNVELIVRWVHEWRQSHETPPPSSLNNNHNHNHNPNHNHSDYNSHKNNTNHQHRHHWDS